MINNKNIFRAAFVSALLFFLPVLSQAAVISSHLRSRLSSGSDDPEIPIIVTFEQNSQPHFATADRMRSFDSPQQRRNAVVASMRNQAAESRQDLAAFLVSRGIGDIDPLWIINGISLKATPELIDEISRWPGVAEVKVNGAISAPTLTVHAATGPAEWNISAVGAPDLWAQGMTGENVVIAGFDTGVDILHPDLAGRWRGGTGTSSWFDPYHEHDAAPYDYEGHGTSVMGVMVGGNNDGTTIGVAPDAKWIAAKIFNDAGAATYVAIHQAFQWALDPNSDLDTSDAPDIVNSSWGLDSSAINDCISEFQPDIQALKAAGIAVVFAGGNNGPDPSTSTSPANYPESLAVGATDLNNTVAGWSARGPSACPSSDLLFPHVSAPGVNIKVADLTLGGAIADPYAYGTGTSLAAPHVSGLMALLLDSDGYPAATVPELENAIKLSAVDLGGAGPDNDYGYGLINGPAAARRLGNHPPRQALLAAPSDGATDIDTSLTFLWTPAVDPDGDPLTETVVFSETGQSAAAAAFSLPAPGSMFPRVGFVLFLGGLVLLSQRKARVLRLVFLLAAGVVALNSCGGGGGGGGSSFSSYSVSNLKSNTAYSWKVVSADRYGGETESATWSFVTR